MAPWEVTIQGPAMAMAMYGLDRIGGVEVDELSLELGRRCGLVTGEQVTELRLERLVDSPRVSDGALEA